MYMVMGGTGHVGSAVAAALLREKKAVTVLTRDARHADEARQAGADIAEVDINEVDALQTVLRHGRRAFLLNPPADITADTDATETSTITFISVPGIAWAQGGDFRFLQVVLGYVEQAVRLNLPLPKCSRPRPRRKAACSGAPMATDRPSY